jgi:arylsulfotransferase ASST
VHDLDWSRRGLIRGALATAAAAAVAWPATANAADPASDTVRFFSRPDLRPPRVAITRRRAIPAAPSYFLLTTEGPAGQHGLLILDQDGDTVWFSPAAPGGLTKDLNVQEYQGKPVLTWWANTQRSANAEIGEGLGFIADSEYQVIAKVAAGNGLKSDFHELNLTSRGTALITAFRVHKADLSKVRGPARGTVLSGVAQEIDIATGKVVFEWDSLNHVPVTETIHIKGRLSSPFDYFHINSISVAHDGDLIISGRNTSAVYKVDRATGAVRWRLGGRESSFAMGPGASFWRQHDVREIAPNVLSIFDDASAPGPEKLSRGILLDLDSTRMRATLRRAYPSPTRLRAANQGSMQVLDDGRVLVGWGDRPAFTEFTADGTEILNGELPPGDWSYRAFAANWTGIPDERPAAVAQRSRSGAVVYASWNGATEVASWKVYAGPKEGRLTPAASRRRTGFETAIPVPHGGPYFEAEALDAHGRILGRSSVIQ